MADFAGASTDIDRYTAALADVNNTIARASGGVTSLDGLRALVELGPVAARPWAEVRDQVDAGFHRAITTRDAALVATCAKLMDMISLRARAALLGADGQPKPFAENAAIDLTAGVGDDLEAGAAAVASGLSTLWIVAIVGAALLGVVVLVAVIHAAEKRA